MALNYKRLEEITRSLKPTHQTGKSFHATFVYNKNKLICTAHNNYNKLHPYHRFGSYVPTKHEKGNYIPGIHSEVAALLKMGQDDCSDLTFINIRIDNNDDVAISKPCPNCQNLLDSIGYKKIVYYDGTKYVESND